MTNPSDPNYQQPYTPPGTGGQMPNLPQNPYGYPPVQPYQSAPPPYEQSGGGKAMASMILGIVSLLAWCIPLFGLPASITGLVLGIKDLNSKNRGMAIAGIIMCSIGLLLSLVNAVWGAYLGATGQHSLINQIQGKH